jgi:hypothetical protein
LSSEIFRLAKNREFRDPEPFLRWSRAFQLELGHSGTPPKIANLRTNKLKSDRERWEAALFCYGMSKRLGSTVYLGPGEAADSDFIALVRADDENALVPVQLKEVVPSDINPTASISQVIAGLQKYTNSPELTVAIHLNRAGRFDPELVPLPTVKLAGLYVFGSISPDQSVWRLWGDFLGEYQVTDFEHPGC